jgi:hypothetical protein
MLRSLLFVFITMFLYNNVVFADDVYYKTKLIEAENTWSDPIPVGIGCGANISISPDTSPVMVIELQRKLKGDSSWGRMVERWTLSAASLDIERISKDEQEDGVQHRIGCPTGDYTSGSCTVRVGTGRLP